MSLRLTLAELVLKWTVLVTVVAEGEGRGGWPGGRGEQVEDRLACNHLISLSISETWSSCILGIIDLPLTLAFKTRSLAYKLLD